MARGRGRASKGCVGKSSSRGNFAIRENIPSFPIPSSSPQLGGMSSSSGPNDTNQIQTSGHANKLPVIPIQASAHGSPLPSHLESSPIIPNPSNTIGRGTYFCSNIIGDQVECSSTN